MFASGAVTDWLFVGNDEAGQGEVHTPYRTMATMKNARRKIFTRRALKIVRSVLWVFEENMPAPQRAAHAPTSSSRQAGPA